MRDVLTAAGVLLVLGVLAWYVGSVLLRLAAFGWFVFAGVGLLLAGRGDQSPWAPVAFAALGAGCWAAGHVLHRARRGWWPPRSPRACSPDGYRVGVASWPRPRAGRRTGTPGRAEPPLR
jgi:hypothetical protein